ncbi:MAG: sigma 54-interacting transcriptional regulator [Myxococcaceae bacterium]|nr:sigma 54-interacting transcriptional regulator [Myxococcaceae bacterium]MCI0669217.1 sigma 54-interacting transcriptional regulator [Myxococcaceae bacterium]
MSPPSLSAQRKLEQPELWTQLKRLLDRLVGALGGESRMDDGLDILVDFLGADRGLVLLTHADGTPQVVSARGQGRALVPAEREEISRTVVAEALASGRCVVWDPLTARGGSSSSTTLGIVAGLAAPLNGAGGQPRGVLYVDFRDHRKFVEEQQVEFFMAAAVLLGVMLEQERLSEQLRAALQVAQTHCLTSARLPPLEDLLRSPALAPAREELLTALHGRSPMLLLGESGTGKTLLAQALAEASARRPVVRLMLGASDDLNTIASELFGHERGAFSGATARRVGLVEFAHGGTLILDELLNLPPAAQKLLLDFSQFGTYRPLGWAHAEPKRAEVRLIAATNGDVAAALRDGRLREDLYHRLSAVTVTLPPLRERRGDIPALAEAALRRLEPGRPWRLSLELRRQLVAEHRAWPGNMRQLERLVHRARERALARDPNAVELRPEHLDLHALEHTDRPPPAAASPARVVPLNAPTPAAPVAEAWQALQARRAALEAEERQLLQRALDAHGGVVAHAARELGLARTTLSSRLSALGGEARPSASEDGEVTTNRRH